MVEGNKGRTDATAQELREQNLNEKAQRAGNEVGRISWRRKLGRIALLFLSGALMSTAFPPLNLTLVAWIGLIPLFLLVMNKTIWQAWRGGFIWGYGFSVCAFFWLREIEWFIPFGLAFILALFPAFWAMALPAVRRGLMIPVDVQLKGFEETERYNEHPVRHELMFAVVMAAWWSVTEWIRSWIATGLPWNYLATAQWRNISLIQICEFTGMYGVSFVIAMVNVSLALAIVGYYRMRRNGKLRRPVAFIVSLVLVLFVVVVGSYSAIRHAVPDGKDVTFTVAALQGDISQRRHADARSAEEALDKYLALSAEAVKLKPDLVMWPETAVPYPFRAQHPVCYKYRMGVAQLIQRSGIPFLIGTVDYERLPQGVTRESGTYNSALLIDSSLKIKAQFNKVHTVPFGEYIPFRKYLPGFVIKMIDMGRDLTPGTSLEPMEVMRGVRAGVNICFEDVFSYVARGEAARGANVLLVITNDAWYPTSSEPEQHLANSIFRAVETRLPMVRCGNNSGSCLIGADGRIADSMFKTRLKSGKIEHDIVRRGEGTAVFTVKSAISPKLTFYTRFGDVFIMVCLVVVVWGFAWSLWQWRKKKEALRETFEA